MYSVENFTHNSKLLHNQRCDGCEKYEVVHMWCPYVVAQNVTNPCIYKRLTNKEDLSVFVKDISVNDNIYFVYYF